MKQHILRECVRIAKSNCTVDKHPEYYGFLHYSFIVSDNKIVEWATNKRGNNQHLVLNGYPEHTKLHAEPEAYRRAKGLIGRKEFEIVNVRVNRSGDLRYSAPCACCYRFMSNLNCKKFWFTTTVGFASIK